MNRILDHSQKLTEVSKRDERLKETVAMLHAQISQTQATTAAATAQYAQVKESTHNWRPSRTTLHRTLNKGITDFSFGTVKVCHERSMEPSKSHRTTSMAKQSHFSMVFVPSSIFWQTMIQFRLVWTTRLNSLMAPMTSLRFLDIVQSDHPVIKASIRGNLHILESALSIRNVSPLCSTNAGWTPLHFAAAYGRIHVCRLLLTHGAPLDANGFRGITPLHLAAHFGHFGVFKALLQAGSDPNDHHENGLNAIFEILSNETVSSSPDLPNILKWLLLGQEQFALDVEARDNFERGILYYLAYPPGWKKRAIKVLTLDQSVAIDFVLCEGFKGDELDICEGSVLHDACRDNRLDLVEKLLSGGCRVNAVDGRRYTPLHYAVETKILSLYLCWLKADLISTSNILLR